jgi:hypothetical protein
MLLVSSKTSFMNIAVAPVDEQHGADFPLVFTRKEESKTKVDVYQLQVPERAKL